MLPATRRSSASRMRCARRSAAGTTPSGSAATSSRVILPEADERDAGAAAQRIADELQLSASFGVAVCGADCEAGTLLREADDAMYRMKRRRRAQELRATEGDDLSAVV